MYRLGVLLLEKSYQQHTGSRMMRLKRRQRSPLGRGSTLHLCLFDSWHCRNILEGKIHYKTTSPVLSWHPKYLSDKQLGQWLQQYSSFQQGKPLLPHSRNKYLLHIERMCTGIIESIQYCS